ncbi:TonB-dependent receptor [uncultured Algibacter sp.]|uniref:SusC/RagA family TonB-linked outer membrane protein n=1 Tax=uncultured Algibacter sp. TaxID=298659 RepID=UPI0026398F08|nr:TonB-dependent receptor [uncultured Algibacter sp.]
MKKTKQLKQTLFLLLGFCFVLSIDAQNKTITGTVTSKTDGLTLPGVNVIVKGTSNGASTDFDGNYSINVTEENAILVFSYVGYKSLEITVGSSNQVNVQLDEDLSALDEVVVVGYGSRKKSDLTGSVSSVKSEELTAFPVLDAQQALQGRAAGVAVQSNNGGEPGAPISVVIRGNASVNGNSSALVVVDGFVGATYPQPGDIASVEVLKDASATAIYGSRGANGVILVTTKKGKKGKMTVELNSNFAIQSTSNRLDLLNANQFVNYNRQINSAYVQGPDSTNWQDLIFTTGHTTNHQLSFSGGSDKMNYYVSGNYFDQDGVVINSGFERFSFLTNIDAQINDKLKIGFNAFGSRSNKDGVSSQADSGGRGSGDVISIAYRFVPDIGVLDENGNNTFNPVGDNIDNPFAVATERVDETVEDIYRANFYGEYKILDNLVFKSTFGFNSRNETRGQYTPSTLITSAADVGGIASIENLKRNTLLTENYFTYTKEIGKGNITALVGFSYQKDEEFTNSTGAQGFITNSTSYLNLATASVPLLPESFFRDRELQSLYGRINYSYDDRYLITLTARRDGSSVFAKNNKYAFFPSGAIGWKISNEDFLKDSATISNLKLRASYGASGNPSITEFQSFSTFTPIYTAVGDQTVNAVVPGRPANPNLRWETSSQANIGIDLGLWNNRVSLSLDYYNIETNDLVLRNSSTAEYTGFLEPDFFANIGELSNTGFEVVLSTRNISTDNFSWSTDFNWSRNRNEIVKLAVSGEDLFLDSAAPGHFLQDDTHILREGEPIGQFFGYEYRGVYQGGGLPEGTATFSGAVAGDELFTDVEVDGVSDGVINSADRKIIGDPNQDWTFGLNNTFKYKDFDLGIFFQGAIGGDIYSFTLSELASGGSNATTEALNVWTPSNTNTNVPRASARERRINSRFVYDGSYVRLKNLVFGYSLPSQLANKLGMDNVRLSLSGQNLLTITDYPGTDPEVSYQASGNRNGNVNRGFDYGNYPNIESITFSVNLKF